MGWGNGNLGGGGASLNFKVVGGTTQPENPKENTIWVNTDTAISEWVFSATQPTNPVEGMVWFQTGASAAAAFNALKKNNLTVYPVACKQYVNDAWANKAAITFQGGTWISWINVLFKNGDQYSAITGGWAGYQELNVKVNIGNSLKMNGTGTNNNNTLASIYTQNPVDVTYAKTLKLDDGGVSAISGGGIKIGLSAIRPDSKANAQSVYSGNNIANAYYSRENSSLDISSVSGEYYVFVIVSLPGSASYTVAMETSEVKLL